MAAEAYAGVRTAMRGGDAASVTTAMAGAGITSNAACAISPFIPTPVWAGVGSVNTIITGCKTVSDTRNAISVFNNPNATSLDKLNAVTDVAEDVVGFFGSVKMTVDAFKTIFSNKDFNSLCRRHKASDDADITDPPKVATDDTVDSDNATNVLTSRYPIENIEDQLATERDKAFFWSGKTDGVGGLERAKDIALRRGGTTLEATLDAAEIKLPEYDPKSEYAVEAWNEASLAYAKQASGEVHAIIGNSLRPGSVWETFELPTLKSNPNVTKIIVIDPKTLAETVIFER